MDGASLSSNPFSFGKKMFSDFQDEKAALTIPEEEDKLSQNSVSTNGKVDFIYR